MRLGRVAAVTASIALIGALIGGVVGAVLLSLWSLAIDFSHGGRAGTVAAGSAFSAALGAVLAPTTAWLFLRRVALGRAIAHSTVGTTIGAAIGIAIETFVLGRTTLQFAVIGALIGFFAAAARLRLTTKAAPARASADAHGP
jgi:hypothetical protein